MRLRHGIGFAVFCVLAGSRWLVDAVWPSTRPPLMAQSFHYAVAGLTALTVSILRRDFRRDQLRRSRPRLFYVSFASLLLLGVPMLLQQAAPAIQPVTSVALYAIVPLCVIVGMTVAEGDEARALMLPALAGLAGALLLLPWHPPVTPSGIAAFSLVVAGVVLTAVGSVWMYALTRGKPFFQSVAVVALSNATVLGVFSAIYGERMAALSGGDYAALVVDVPQILLLVWLIGEVAPMRLTTRFLLIPLVTVIEGAITLRSSLDGRAAVGILLLLFSAGLLLFGGREYGVSLSLK